ncbi:permease for cytosine/purines, uracil, thiamine, allantoin-domain-containing protein [Xylaria arbuscula]|nr:permease for cytosine/purines, uracil, thiamine, allantoin-domain-containing protein [Xylaria arbuscula]
MQLTMSTKLKEKASAFRHALTSRVAMVHYLEAPLLPGDDINSESRRWTNRDLALSPPQDRKWNQWTFLAFWVAHAAGAGGWTTGSSLIAVGLEPLSAWLAIASSHILITFLIVLNGRASSRYHIGFPVLARSSFGMWGSYMAIAMRAIVCIIWNGTNSYYGGKCVTVAITAIWPQFGRLPNTLPASAGITTKDFTSFWIFMAVFIAISFVHSRDLRWFYVGKSIFVFVAMHSILIWYLVTAGGVSITTLANSDPPTGSAYVWLVLRAFNSGLGNASSLTVNQGDMTRYAKKPSDALWTTLISYPIASALPALYGILVAACAKKLTGTAFWSVWDVLGFMLEQYPNNHGARFGIFLCATALALAFLAVNLATNSLPFGSDLSALFPRWMTIRRGQVLCTILGIAVVPWKLLNSASAFLTFLSGYGYWLAPIAAIMSIDYYIVKKGNINTRDIFVGNSSSRYWFVRGVNPRAVATVLISLVPCLPSFAAQIAPNHLNMTSTGVNFFYISFTFTWTLAALLYYLSYVVFPEKGEIVVEKSLRREQWADDLEREEMAALILGVMEEATVLPKHSSDGTRDDEKVEVAKLANA